MSSRDSFGVRPDGRKKKSGSAYKKEREAKKAKEAEVIEKTKKLDTFFCTEKIDAGKLKAIQTLQPIMNKLYSELKFKIKSYAAR